MSGRIGRFVTTVGLALGCWAGLFVLGVLLVGCDSGGGTVSGPEPVNQPAPAPAVAAEAPAAPTPVADPTTTPDHECSIGKDASFSVKNNSTIPQQYAAWWTDFDNQDLVRGTHGPFEFKPGDSMIGSFNRQCVQVDVGQTVNGTPYCFGFIDKEGNPFVPSRAPEKVAACRTKPCVEKWTVDEKPEVNYGKWSECAIDQGESITQTCSKSRTVTTIYYETNSCTQERRVARKSETTEKEACECPCIEKWTEVKEPKIITGDWSECVLGERTRTDIWIYYEISSCTEETRELRRKEKKYTEECQTPGHCYYKINSGKDCSDSGEPAHQAFCEAAGYTWINFTGSKLDNHCDVPFPGIANKCYELTKGQSADGCLKKKD